MLQQIEKTKVVDVEDFNSRVISSYNKDSSAEDLVADLDTARSIIPGGTGYIVILVTLALKYQCMIHQIVLVVWNV